MGWRRCPRCKSGAVVIKSRGTSCFGCLLFLAYFFTIVSILVWLFSGAIKEAPLQILSTFLVLIGIIVLITYLKKEFGKEPKDQLYCKSCELHFKN